MNGRFLPAFFGLSVILFCSSRTICFSENNSFYLEDNFSLVSPLPKRSSFENEMRDSNRLAFSVEKPGKFVSNDGTPVIVEDKEGSNFDPTSYYIINRVGFSYSTKETVKPKSFLKYDLGYNLNLETGLKIDRWKIGLLLNYQYNEWDSSSHVHVDGSQQPLCQNLKFRQWFLNPATWMYGIKCKTVSCDLTNFETKTDWARNKLSE